MRKEIYYCSECKNYWTDGDPIWIPSGQDTMIVFEKEKKLSTVQADLENAKMLSDVCRVKICPECSSKVIIRKCNFCKRSHTILTEIPPIQDGKAEIETFIFSLNGYKWIKMKFPENKIKIKEVPICSLCETNAMDVIKDYGNISIIIPKFEIKDTHVMLPSLKNFLVRKYEFETDGELKFIISTMKNHYFSLEKATKMSFADKELKIKLELQPMSLYYIKAKWRDIRLPKLQNTIAEVINK
jgi:hypothetical protein